MKKHIKKLCQKALWLRRETWKMFFKKGEAHLGGSFSMIETLLFVYEKMLKKEDIFILSKSHSSYPLCILLRKKGLKTKITTHLELDKKNGVNCTSGSLGHGLPIAAGYAFAKKMLNKKGKVYVVISDGECQEGTTWETFLICNKLKLSNLIIIVDYNKIQALSFLKDGLPIENLSKKIQSFNLNSINIKNGHSFDEISKGFKKIKNSTKTSVIILNTIKSKGIKEFENNPVWHAKKISDQDYKIGIKRLGIR